MLKKVISAMLAVLILIPLIAACATGKEADETTTTTASSGTADATESKTQIAPALPDVKYTGYKFNVANGFVNETKYTTNAIMSETLNAEPINDALYLRTTIVEEQFDIEIVDSDVNVDGVINSIAAGEDVYTIATINLSNIMRVVNLGYAVDFYTIDSIDLTNPWWDHNAEQKLSFAGRLYYTFSDMLITGLDNSRATYFNKTLLDQLQLENPYELVAAGKWTIEKMQQMAKVAVAELDGDGKITQLDRVGIANNATTFYEAMLTGCDAEIMKQGRDGIPYFTCFDEREFFINVYQGLLDLFTADNCYLITDTNTARSMFINGQTLFVVDTLLMASKSRQEDINFGILPVAKYDESQEKYWHVSPNPHAMMVPITTSDLTRTGVLLEALSYYSSTYYSDHALIPAYYELALKAKSATDVESAEMLTLIHDHISYVIKIVGTDFSDAIYSLFSTGNRNIASLLKNRENAMKKKLAETIEKLR
ncbi:MAG: hypothetical protein ACOYIA_06435 [Eubacteriales bacterium]|jgi:hypothetical protein